MTHRCASRRVGLQPVATDTVRVGSRRWLLQTGLAGIAGLSAADILREQARAADRRAADPKSVIMIWLSGGPSHLDFWDPKPEAPLEIRGPFDSIPTRVPGIRFCEHLPLHASIADRLAILRAVDCRDSIDHCAAVMQIGNSQALKDLQPTLDGPRVARIPSIGSMVARFRGANDPAMPAFVGMASPALTEWHSDIWGAGPFGPAYDPIPETALAGRLKLPTGVNVARVQDRTELRRQFDRLRREFESERAIERLDHFGRQALDMTLSPKTAAAFQLDDEPAELRDAYGRDSFGEKALLARRLVEAGSTYVVISPRFGVFDNHGDDVIWGGLLKGLKPLFPGVDRSLFALVTDLESRGLLDSTLILMLGEFGRAPVIANTGGRTHWTNCMSVLVAGGGIQAGQALGSTDERGYDLKDGRVIPADLAATIYRHLDIDLTTQWTDGQGRPHPLVSDGGQPIAALF
jgi:hypothetical protein